MATTRPKLEQVEFRSSRTGSHSLDAYLESAEYGNRTLPDLLGDFFQSNGTLRDDLFEFRVNPDTFALQTRRGLYLGPNSNWVNVPQGFFFRPRGNWQPNTFYDVHDLFLFQQSLFMVTVAHTSGATQPDIDKALVIINGIAGRIPIEDAALAGNANNYLRVRTDENGYELVESTLKATFYGFKTSADGSEIILTRTRDEDVRVSDFDTHMIGDLGYVFEVRNNDLVIVM